MKSCGSDKQGATALLPTSQRGELLSCKAWLVLDKSDVLFSDPCLLTDADHCIGTLHRKSFFWATQGHSGLAFFIWRWACLQEVNVISIACFPDCLAVCHDTNVGKRGRDKRNNFVTFWPKKRKGYLIVVIVFQCVRWFGSKYFWMAVGYFLNNAYANKQISNAN